MIKDLSGTLTPPTTGDVVRAIGGKGCVGATLLVLILVGGFLGFIIYAGAERGHSARSRYARDMGSLIESYLKETGKLPAMVPMENYATTDEQRKILKGTHLFTADPGTTATIGLLNFDTTYRTELPTDGYMGLPIAYYTDGKGYMTFCPSRDGDFDIKDATKVFSSDKGMEDPRLKPLINESNRESDGDLVYIGILPTQTQIEGNP